MFSTYKYCLLVYTSVFLHGDASTHLPVDGSDDRRAKPHARDKAVLKVLMQDEGL